MRTTMMSFLITAMLLLGCSNINNQEGKRKLILMNTQNVVKLTDTLEIYESACRGCAYENSTNFSISDSMGLIKLVDVETVDNNSTMIGGSVTKYIVMSPVKTGITKIKLYTFLTQGRTSQDSINYSTYTIEVRN